MAKQTGKKGLGCFFYGCLTVLVVLVVGAIAATWMVKGFTDSMIQKYTAEQSVEIPSEPLPPEELKDLQTRLAEFERASQEGREYELTMNSEELNAFINQTGRFKEIEGHVHLTIEDDEIQGTVSLPLTELGKVPMLGAAQGRYFNGEIALRLSLQQGGQLTAHLTGLSVNGKALPERIFREIQSQNLLDTENQDQWDSSDWDHLESLEVEDGEIRVRTKPRAQTGGQSAPAEESEPFQVEGAN